MGEEARSGGVVDGEVNAGDLSDDEDRERDLIIGEDDSSGLHHANRHIAMSRLSGEKGREQTRAFPTAIILKGLLAKYILRSNLTCLIFAYIFSCFHFILHIYPFMHSILGWDKNSKNYFHK